MRITGRWLLVSWLVAALVMLGLEGRLTAFLAWATPSTLLVLGVGAPARQQRAPSFLDRPPRPYRYRVADDLGQPIAAVVAAAEHEATLTSGLTAPGLGDELRKHQREVMSLPLDRRRTRTRDTEQLDDADGNKDAVP